MSLSNCQDGLDLFLLYELTTFYEEDRRYDKDGQYYPKWRNLKEDDRDDYEYVYVPQCSHFGSTLICLSNTYENSGYDCLFIQELVRLYMAGRIEIKEKKN